MTGFDGKHLDSARDTAAEERRLDFEGALAQRDSDIKRLERLLAERDVYITHVLSSSSWRLLAPLRFVVHQGKRLAWVLRRTPALLRRGGGFVSCASKVVEVYRREGWSGVKRRLAGSTPQALLLDGSLVDCNDYEEWVRRYDSLTDELRSAIRDQVGALATRPLISVVMPVYNPNPIWLSEAIQSVRAQLYPNWELCIADDASTNKEIRPLLETFAAQDLRIKVVFREQNGHISVASNSALQIATGDWIALLDHDDVLAEHALFCVAQTIVSNPSARLIYSDEDKVSENGVRYDPYFKPDWNPALFYSHNMICHLGIYFKPLIEELEGFCPGFEGAQDYDLALRFIERIGPDQIVHVPRVLYHWRAHAESTAQAGEAKPYAVLAGERALNQHFERTKIAGHVEIVSNGYRARYKMPDREPLASIVIPTRNGLQLIRQCIESILGKTQYTNYEIIVVDNGSDDPEALSYFESLKSIRNIRVLRDERPFNYSQLNNFAVSQAHGEIIVMLNNDIQVISPEWLGEMIALVCQPGVGAVGAKLLYPDGTVQHAGVVCGIGGCAGHVHKGLPRDAFGYVSRASVISGFTAVTGACLVVQKSVYQQVGGLNERELKVAFNDVDFCLRLCEAGYRNVWTPYVELYHHESATRGYEDTPQKQARFKTEVRYIKARWGDSLLNDPAYNPNLTLTREDFSFAWPPRLPALGISNRVS